MFGTKTSVGIDISDDELKDRINKRAEKWLTGNLIEEAKSLHREGLSYERMRVIGLEYTVLADYLEKKIDKDELLEKIKTKTWQYARKQKMWFKRDKRICWVNSPEKANELLN